MQILFEPPKEELFLSTKQKQNKHHIEELSPYIEDFFQVFLKQ
jgi:hypothetical protein